VVQEERDENQQSGLPSLNLTMINIDATITNRAHLWWGFIALAVLVTMMAEPAFLAFSPVRLWGRGIQPAG